MRLISLATAFTILGLSLGGAVFAESHSAAEMTPEEAFAARSALMKSMGGGLRTIGGLTGTAMVDAANLYVSAFDKIPSLYPEGSIVGDSRALPAIWENWDGFLAASEKGAVVAANMLVAAEAGDQAEFVSLAQGLGRQVCGACHSDFRAEKP